MSALSSTDFSTPSRLGSLFTKIDSLFTTITDLKSSLPTIIREELLKHENKNCIAIYGIPENSDPGFAVNAILSHCGLAEKDYNILYRLGKRRMDGSNRPLKVKISDNQRVPHLTELARKIRAVPALSTFYVRKYETPEQRKAGFIAREERRRQSMEMSRSSSPDESLPVETKRCVESPPIAADEMECNLPDEGNRDKPKDTMAEIRELLKKINETTPKGFPPFKRDDAEWTNEQVEFLRSQPTIGDMYCHFRRYPKEKQKIISDAYVAKYFFRLHIE